MSVNDTVISCESVAAIVVHIRIVGSVEPNYSGHSPYRPPTLCGAEAAWDTKSSVKYATCRSCREDEFMKGYEE